MRGDGLADDTIVFYYSDNGGVLPRSKRFLRGKRHARSADRLFSAEMAASRAGAARLADQGAGELRRFRADGALAGRREDSRLHARPRVGRPGQGRANEFAFITRDRMDERYDMMRSVMDSRWLYIRNYRPDLPYVQPLNYLFQARGYQSWARVAREGKLTPATAMFWGEKPTEELYDMLADPDSVHNLAADPAHRETLDRMRAALEKRVHGQQGQRFPARRFGAGRLRGFACPRRVPDRARLRAGQSRLRARRRQPAETDRGARRSHASRSAGGPRKAARCSARKPRPPKPRLRKRLDDKSGAVQVAAAEALARLGKLDMALPVLQRWIQKTDTPPFALQAANVLDRLGEAARPALPAIKAGGCRPAKRKAKVENYLVRILTHVIDVLEGREQPLVYPAKPAAQARATYSPLPRSTFGRCPERGGGINGGLRSMAGE